MNSQATAAKITASDLIMETINVCEKLTNFLAQENQNIKERKVNAVEKGLEVKNKLTHRFEKLITVVKNKQEVINKDIKASKLLPSLQKIMKKYKEFANKNLMLLQSAHTATASFLDSVREALVSKQPKGQVYGKDAKVQKSKENKSLLNKSI